MASGVGPKNNWMKTGKSLGSLFKPSSHLLYLTGT